MFMMATHTRARVSTTHMCVCACRVCTALIIVQNRFGGDGKKKAPGQARPGQANAPIAVAAAGMMDSKRLSYGRVMPSVFGRRRLRCVYVNALLMFAQASSA